eukprot:NODE_673_length_1522_cov_117.439919_g553_i0.p1 GENE.NODE_673_length_1522_cov_117.439919_g553_i0~~NODE_673_length_1522_cov_117.439919_g553_i0.p1  ORF type:complete len:285 (-),score=54.04 NODE_673_length_1522_cov_117.439919_g553_i0:45-899(-)
MNQIPVFMRRSLNQLLRRPADIVVDMLLICIGSSGCGFIFGPNGNWGLTSLEPLILFSILILGLLTTMSALRIFGNEMLFFHRESAAGVSIHAYYIAKFIFFLHDTILRPLIYVTLFYAFVQPYMKYYEFYFVGVAVTFSCTALGILLSVSCNARNALLAAVVLPFVLGGMFSGFVPSMNEAKKVGFMWFVSHFSFGRWALEALAILEYLEARGHELEHSTMSTCILWLFFNGFLFHILAYIVMVLSAPQSRGKKALESFFVWFFSRSSNNKKEDLEQPLLPLS